MKVLLHDGDGNILRAKSTIDDVLSYDDTISTGALDALGDAVYSNWVGSSADDVSAELLIVAGGGCGGIGDGLEGGGGGGAGGVLYIVSELLDTKPYTIVVGDGGRFVSSIPESGKNSSFGTQIAIGGGNGGRTDTINEGADGGSGGGARGASFARAGGTGTAGQGTNGGIGCHKSGGGGGGGATTVGGNSPGDATLGNPATVQNNEGGDGGSGRGFNQFTDYGDSGFFGGGGGGGSWQQSGGVAGTGGSGGGGDGGGSANANGQAGRKHSGSGGGGSTSIDYNICSPGNGGSGIVIVRYRVPLTRGPRSFPFLYGGQSDGLRFPTDTMDDTKDYTLFHVARYYKPSGTPIRGRIFDGVSSNWLSGFYAGKSGVAYHNGWLTAQTNRHGDTWIVSCDQKDLYISNGVDRTITGSGSTSRQLSINYGIGVSTESSDWAVAEVIIYDKELTSSEYKSVQAYLLMKYLNYGRIPTTSGEISGSMISALYYTGNQGVGGTNGYPISIGRLGVGIGTTYQNRLDASDFKITLTAGLVERTYTSLDSGYSYRYTPDDLTSYINTGTRTSGPTVITTSISGIGANVDNYYAKVWVGYIYIETDGIYYFGTNSDDESDMHINYTLVTSAYGGHGLVASGTPWGDVQYKVYLLKGYYKFCYRFSEHAGGDGYQALWQTPGSSTWAEIPSSVFYHEESDKSTATEPTDPTFP
jgi:hypothetical protein